MSASRARRIVLSFILSYRTAEVPAAQDHTGSEHTVAVNPAN